MESYDPRRNTMIKKIIKILENVDAVVVSKGEIPAEYMSLPLLNEGFSYDLAHKLGLYGKITVYDVFLKDTRTVDVGGDTDKAIKDEAKRLWEKTNEDINGYFTVASRDLEVKRAKKVDVLQSSGRRMLRRS